MRPHYHLILFLSSRVIVYDLYDMLFAFAIIILVILLFVFSFLTAVLLAFSIESCKSLLII